MRLFHKKKSTKQFFRSVSLFIQKAFLWLLFLLAFGYGSFVWYTSLYTLGSDGQRMNDLMNRSIFVDLETNRFDEFTKTIDARIEKFKQESRPSKNMFKKE